MDNDVLYYSHNEFNPHISSRKCTIIPLNDVGEFHEPSCIATDVKDNQVSIDIHYQDRDYTFVSDNQSPTSANIIMIVFA